MHTTPDKILSYPSPQLLRDMRHEDHCHSTKGFIGKCTHCQLEFTTQDIVNNALNRWNKMATGKKHANVTFPVQRHCLDVYAIRHMYDLYSSNRKQCCNISSPCSLAHNEHARKCMLNLRFNEHAAEHSPSCFKKGHECRHNLPNTLSKDTTLDFRGDPVTVHHLSGNTTKI